MSVFLVCLAALLLDRLVGEPRVLHPLMGFGWLTMQFEVRARRPGFTGWLLGGLGVLLLAGIPALVAGLAWLFLQGPALWALEALVLWLAIGLRSLREHALAVADPLVRGDIAAAREAVAMLVSRDGQALDESGIAVAATESSLENGADAVFASLFWFVLAGLPGLVLHRLVNTLDAMWGYRTRDYADFGHVAARLDDLLNWLPARLTALSYALAGSPKRALSCWWQQAGAWSSPNAGPVMAAGAGALGLRLGGPAAYHGRMVERPWLGQGAAPTGADIHRALALIHRALGFWLLAILLGGVITWLNPFGLPSMAGG